MSPTLSTERAGTLLRVRNIAERAMLMQYIPDRTDTMPDWRKILRETWTRLNPSDPSPAFLAKLMAIMVGAMVIGLIVGPL